MILIAILSSSSVEANSWVYKQDSEKLTDKQYSYAFGYASDYEYNNDFTVSFQCSDGKVRFEINVDKMIESKGKEFSFAYRVDYHKAREITLRTFSNNSEGGYTYDNVQQIAQDMIGGNKMFVRAITWNNNYLEANIYLAGADSAIRKVFSDCGVSLDSTTKSPKSSYSLNDFTKKFKKLTPANQQKVLNDLQELINKY